MKNTTNFNIQKFPTFILLILLFICNLAHSQNPIIFVTQPPHPSDFATANATFGNHQASLYSIPRGGDLYIRYANGTLKNLTQSAGFGNSGMQGATAIAVRDPSVHWNGQKVIFSMVIGAPTARYQVNEYRWQMYEITGLGQSDTPLITKVNNQPEDYNNVMPIYGTDGRIIFVTDRPRAGATHHYPQRDEYESTPTNTGLWSLDPTTGDLFQLDHSPSGDFHPMIDSFGRVIFTRWDHLQRDQQNRCSNEDFGAFNYSSESEEAETLDSDSEVFPEKRGMCDEGPTNLNRHSFNHFLPWQINESGKEMETLNHIGRHELVSYIERTFNDDDNVEEFYSQYDRFNDNDIENIFHIKEDPNTAGDYYGVNAPEFGTHTAGQIVKINGAPSVPADQMAVTYITHPDTSGIDETPSGNHSGLYRDPLKMSNGTLISVHTTSTLQDTNIGSSTSPASRYSFRLKSLQLSGSYYIPQANLTTGIQKTISYWSPDEMVTYNNVTMWELQPVELKSRTKPSRADSDLPAPEQNAFTNAGVDVNEFQEYLIENDLALVVTRNVTTRDAQDHQQPRNLRVAGTNTETLNSEGKIYDVAHWQFFQGDLIRGYAGGSSNSGRRVLAQEMHDTTDNNPPNSAGPTGSVRIAEDGSSAALVPARRALTWQLTDEEGEGVVRERMWLTFQPGEIRVCASCHGVNSVDQAGNSAPTNTPQALTELLEFWKETPADSPTYSLTGTLGGKSGRKLRLDLQGENEFSANKNLALQIEVNNNSCGTVKEIQTDEEGNYEMAMKLPPAVNGKKLKFIVRYQGRELASKSFPRIGSKSKKKMKVSKVCEKIIAKM